MNRKLRYWIFAENHKLKTMGHYFYLRICQYTTIYIRHIFIYVAAIQFFMLTF
jgi:hypothetical protein